MKKQRVTQFKNSKICLYYIKTTDRKIFYKCNMNKKKEVKKTRIAKEKYLKILKILKNI